MRRLQHLRPAKDAKRKKTRKGCGGGSGSGGTAGRGHKGQKHRSKVQPWFEGGQMPIQRRLTHKGFNNRRFATEYQVVNVELLDRFEDGAEVDPAALKKAGLISSVNRPVKILGRGELARELSVKAHRFSARAKELIEKAGGKVEVLG